METKVLNDIGLDSGSGYDMNRMSAKDLLGNVECCTKLARDGSFEKEKDGRDNEIKDM